MQETSFLVLSVKYTDYDPEVVYHIEILSIQGDSRTLYQSVINPELPIFDYTTPTEFGICAEEIDVAPTFPEVFDEISSQIANQIVFHHTAGSIIALQAVSERYNLEKPEATYINSERIVRRLWQDFTHRGYGLRNMRQVLNIPCELTATEAIYEIIQQSAVKFDKTFEELIELATKSRVRIRVSSHLEGAEGNPEGPFAGETIVFTGALDRPRSDLRDIAVSLGFNFTDTLNKDTTMLVVGTYNNPTVLTTGKSGKLVKAEKYNKEGKANIEIMSSDSFYRMLSEFMIYDE